MLHVLYAVLLLLLQLFMLICSVPHGSETPLRLPDHKNSAVVDTQQFKASGA
jgi:hypothetical protein